MSEAISCRAGRAASARPAADAQPATPRRRRSAEPPRSRGRSAAGGSGEAGDHAGGDRRPAVARGPDRRRPTSPPSCARACRRCCATPPCGGMWSLDPAIRDYVGEAREYAYDWNVPGGVPGNGPLLPTDDVGAMLGRIFGESDRRIRKPPLRRVHRRRDGLSRSARGRESPVGAAAEAHEPGGCGRCAAAGTGSERLPKPSAATVGRAPLDGATRRLRRPRAAPQRSSEPRGPARLRPRRHGGARTSLKSFESTLARLHSLLLCPPEQRARRVRWPSRAYGMEMREGRSRRGDPGGRRSRCAGARARHFAAGRLQLAEDPGRARAGRRGADRRLAHGAAARPLPSE